MLQARLFFFLTYQQNAFLHTFKLWLSLKAPTQRWSVFLLFFFLFRTVPHFQFQLQCAEVFPHEELSNAVSFLSWWSIDAYQVTALSVVQFLPRTSVLLMPLLCFLSVHFIQILNKGKWRLGKNLFKKCCQIQEFVLLKNELLMSSAGHKVKEAGRELDLMFGSRSEDLPNCSGSQRLRLVILGSFLLCYWLNSHRIYIGSRLLVK